MKKVIVKNLLGYQTHGADFATQELAEAWVAEQRQLNSWGLDERWVAETDLLPAEIEDALDQKIENGITFYKLGAQYTVEINDPSVFELAEAELAYRRRAREKGWELIDFIAVVNESNGVTLEELQIILANPQVQAINELLKNGSLIYARQIILGLDESIYSATEKAAVVAKIEAFLTANGKAF